MGAGFSIGVWIYLNLPILTDFKLSFSAKVGGRGQNDAIGNACLGGIRRFNDLLASNPQVDANTIQRVGSKGYDGFAIAVVTENLEDSNTDKVR